MACRTCYGEGASDVCRDCTPGMNTCINGDATGVIVDCKDGCQECDACPFDCHKNETAHPECPEHGQKAN